MQAKIFNDAYEKLVENKIKKLLETAQDYFHLIHSFRKNEQLTNFVNVWMLEGPYENARICELWTFSNIFLQKPFFSQRKQQSAQLQKTNKQCY